LVVLFADPLGRELLKEPLTASLTQLAAQLRVRRETGERSHE
jgi:hypothetical protein